MGVRVYTLFMPITSTNTFTLATIQRLIIDCSVIQNTSAHQDIEELLAWVQTIHMRSNIHVTVRFSTGNPVGKKIRTKFQSLGCRVSMQTTFR